MTITYGIIVLIAKAIVWGLGFWVVLAFFRKDPRKKRKLAIFVFSIFATNFFHAYFSPRKVWCDGLWFNTSVLQIYYHLDDTVYYYKDGKKLSYLCRYSPNVSYHNEYPLWLPFMDEFEWQQWGKDDLRNLSEHATYKEVYGDDVEKESKK